jgi:MFS family permease
MITFTIEGLIICLGIKTNVNTKTFSSTQESDSQKVGEKKLWLRFIKNRRMRAILIFFTVDLFVYGISLSIYNAGLSDYYNLTTEQISFIVIWMNIANMVFQIPAGRVADKLGKMKTLILSEFFGLIFMLLNIIAPLLWGNSSMGLVLILLILGRVSFAFSIVFFIPSEQIILTDLGKDKRAEAYGIVTFVRGIAFIPTGLIGGFLIENISYFAPFIISSIGILFEIWFLFRFFNQE